jgi:hypothetical protein
MGAFGAFNLADRYPNSLPPASPLRFFESGPIPVDPKQCGHIGHRALFGDIHQTSWPAIALWSDYLQQPECTALATARWHTWPTGPHTAASHDGWPRHCRYRLRIDPLGKTGVPRWRKRLDGKEETGGTAQGQMRVVRGSVHRLSPFCYA